MKLPITRRILSLFAALFLGSIAATYVDAQETPLNEALGKARAAIRSAKYQDALKDVNIVLTKNPTNADAWCLKGEIQTRLKDATAALESFNKAIQADKLSINAVVGKANALAELKKEAEAQELLRQAISMAPSFAIDFLARGAAFRALGQFDKALADYDEALKRNPDFPEVQMNKGVVYWHKGDYSSAIPLFTAAIKADPNFVEALANRGAAYRKKGDMNAAIADYSKAIQINPNDAMTFYNRGVAYQKQQLHEKAIADFTSAIRLQPRYPEAYLNRGVAYTGVNKIAEARRDFQKAAEQDPSGEAGQKARRGLEMIKGY
jgi:tetratricopeptide (TPR) repeat protein